MSARQYLVVGGPILLLVLIALAGCATSGGVECAAEPTSGVTNAFLLGFIRTAPMGTTNSMDQPDGVVLKATKFRYRMYVSKQLVPGKIVFRSSFLYDPNGKPNGRPYSVDSNYIGSGAPGGLFLSNADYHGEGRTGLQSSDVALFPINSNLIDGIPSVSQVVARAQRDDRGKVMYFEIEKGGTFSSPLMGWGSHNVPDPAHLGQFIWSDSLPTGTYQIWNLRITTDEGTANEHVSELAYAMPAEMSRYIQPDGIMANISEFFEFPGFVQVFYWDMETQSEGETSWRSVRKFVQTYSLDPPGVPTVSGARVSSFRGKPALEYSNDGTGTYYGPGDTFTIPASVAELPPNSLPTIQWAATDQVVTEGAQPAFSITLTLDRPSMQDIEAAIYFRGNALAGVDFASPSPCSDTAMVITIPAGATSKTIAVTLKHLLY
jgi:hypothetical protein